jgi:hypothetical protein
MKRILTIICLLLGLSSFAQFQVFPKAPGPDMRFLNRERPVYSNNTMLYPQLTNNSTSRIYSLPLDKMPALVPDTRQIAPIPNRGMEGFRYSLMMPNALKREEIIPAQ